MHSGGLTVVIYGGEFAAYAASAALSHVLPKTYKLIHVTPEKLTLCSTLYGGVTGPSGYDFFRSLGLEEPDLLISGGATFSYGTYFRNWPSASASWVQCFSQPFQVLQDIPLDQLISASGGNLQDYLIGAQATLAGRFAHPPSDASNPLSRAEYGYHFAADAIARLIEAKTRNEGVERIEGQLEDVSVSDDAIEALRLRDGREIQGDLFIDCSGINRTLMTSLENTYQSERSLSVSVSRSRIEQLGPPCRTITASDTGWQSILPLQGGVEALTIQDPVSDSGRAHLTFETGALTEYWTRNCVALGHAAYVIEPLTSAPINLLHRSLKRLSELIPLDRDMSVERQEYNRQTSEDIANATVFNQAHFVGAETEMAPYWQKAKAAPIGDRLKRKLTQFQSRGHLVQYDLEPFNPEDWAILHYGMGRRPKRHDIRAKAMPNAGRLLDQFKSAIAGIVPRMPPHHQYLSRFRAYLEKKHYE